VALKSDTRPSFTYPRYENGYELESEPVYETMIDEIGRGYIAPFLLKETSRADAMLSTSTTRFVSRDSTTYEENVINDIVQSIARIDIVTTTSRRVKPDDFLINKRD